MSPAARWLFAIGICSLSATAAAAPLGIASAFNGLYSVDLATGVATPLGTYGTVGASTIHDVEGLAMMPDGSLVGVSDANKAMFRFPASSSRAAFVTSLDPSLAGLPLDLGLAASCDGKLYMASDVQRKLWELQPVGGSVRLIADLTAPISGLAYRNGYLYGLAIASPGPESQGLYRIDPANGSMTLIGNFSTPRSVQDAGLDFDSAGRLWATFDYNPPVSGNQADYSDVAELDPATGALLSRTMVRGIDRFEDFEGLAIAPPVCSPTGTQAPRTPVPATSNFGAALLAFALFALALPGMRRLARR